MNNEFNDYEKIKQNIKFTLEEIGKLYGEIARQEEDMIPFKNKNRLYLILIILCTIASVSTLTLIIITNNITLLNAFYASIFASLAINSVSTPSRKEFKYMQKNLDFLKRTVNLYKDDYIKLKDIEKNILENTSIINNEENKDIERVINEVSDEEITLEEKPKVRTRK